jgi:hypothetical protein
VKIKEPEVAKNLALSLNNRYNVSIARLSGCSSERRSPTTDNRHPFTFERHAVGNHAAQAAGLGAVVEDVAEVAATSASSRRGLMP